MYSCVDVISYDLWQVLGGQSSPLDTEACADDTIRITNPVCRDRIAWLVPVDDGMASWQIVVIETDADDAETVLELDGAYNLSWVGQAEYARLLWILGYVARRWLI